MQQSGSLQRVSSKGGEGPALQVSTSMTSWGSRPSSSVASNSGGKNTNVTRVATPTMMTTPKHVDSHHKISHNAKSNEISLSVIDASFGADSDLYNDLLGISYLSSVEQIHDAYFERRNQLFRLLSEIDNINHQVVDGDVVMDEEKILHEQYRYDIERKMDGVVVALRILTDPELRMQYDQVIRKVRLARKQQIKQQLKQRNLQQQQPRPPSQPSSPASLLPGHHQNQNIHPINAGNSPRTTIMGGQQQHGTHQQQTNPPKQQYQYDMAIPASTHANVITPPRVSRSFSNDQSIKNHSPHQQQIQSQQLLQQQQHQPYVTRTNSLSGHEQDQQREQAYQHRGYVIAGQHISPPRTRGNGGTQQSQQPTSSQQPIRSRSNPRAGIPVYPQQGKELHHQQQRYYHNSSESLVPRSNLVMLPGTPSRSSSNRSTNSTQQNDVPQGLHQPHLSSSTKSRRNKQVQPAIIRDSNYVGALLMRENNTLLPPQLPNYLDDPALANETKINDQHEEYYYNHDGSIVSGLTNPTALMASTKNDKKTYSRHRPDGSDSNSVTGTSIEDTTVSNSTMALNSYGPAQIARMNTNNDDDDDTFEDNARDSRRNRNRNAVAFGGSSDKHHTPRATIAPSTPTSILKNRNQNRNDLASGTTRQAAKLKSSDDQQKSSQRRSLVKDGSVQTSTEKKSITKNLAFADGVVEEEESLASTLYGTNTYDENQSTTGGLTTDCDDDDDDDDDISISESLVRRHEEVMNSTDTSTFLDRIRLEILGAIDDTSRSFEQVWNAFTIQPNEIDAVAGRIEKAKRQMTKSLKRGGLPGIDHSSSDLSGASSSAPIKTSSPMALFGGSLSPTTVMQHQLESKGSPTRSGGGISTVATPSPERVKTSDTVARKSTSKSQTGSTSGTRKTSSSVTSPPSTPRQKHSGVV